ncbi:SAM-dependent methyltransferase [Aeoliella mucimassa]|uniref:Cyclopropane-fatty-acyl-phospholipid synthase n=1 Tax=Aeoliella mucimassa TaxID=2527972 RepID=A0A518ANH7_9BACT|nr:cyclopropane-fatty-acyl-phospholipid synthase family protein [Aeoliella mucimassa]QDU56285.1 Cyclopropane-fatty-acyl-phospholipid synthase [Aeoliella mucimassa]
MLTTLAEKRYLPDRAIRYGMRRLLAERLRKSRLAEESTADFAKWLREVDEVAVATDQANSQHYEVPTEFFETVLGPHLKYSCGYWDSPEVSLGESEAAMLSLTCQRARLVDGQQVLELGCGWGSLSLWMAEHYPASQITAMSNSATQREYILQQAEERGLNNLVVHTANIASFEPPGTYDRVVSVEMFEHVRNYQNLLSRIRSWLNPGGQLFVHIFCHRQFAYPFEVDAEQGSDAQNWMTQHFFTGGVMPSYDLLREFADHMVVDDSWWIDGRHYARTCETWLKQLDVNHSKAKAALAEGDNPAPVTVQLQRWRMFFMACAELFSYDAGRQWGVGHYLLKPRG